MQTVAGVALACLASIFFNAAVVLQAREARAVPHDQGLHLSLLASLAQRRLWLVGSRCSCSRLAFRLGLCY